MPWALGSNIVVLCRAQGTTDRTVSKDGITRQASISSAPGTQVAVPEANFAEQDEEEVSGALHAHCSTSVASLEFVHPSVKVGQQRAYTVGQLSPHSYLHNRTTNMHCHGTI